MQHECHRVPRAVRRRRDLLQRGGLRADGFRVDVPGPDISPQEVAQLFIASLNLLMVGSAQVHDLRVFAEPHKGTRGGPSDRPAPETGRGRIVDLSHPIRDGLITYPGLPGPELRPYLTREQSREQYAPGTEFQIDAVTMVGNTGTYLDSPFHRYADGPDLAALPLESCAELPAVNVDDLQNGGHRPAHSILLRAGIPVVEHLTGLGQLPPTGFWFTAAPIPFAGCGTFPVRAYATIPK